MKGYRKVIMLVIIAAAVLFGPMLQPFSPEQTELLQTLILAAFAGNGLEYVAEVVKDANSRRRSAGAISSVRAVTAPKTVATEEDAH